MTHARLLSSSNESLSDKNGAGRRSNTPTSTTPAPPTATTTDSALEPITNKPVRKPAIDGPFKIDWDKYSLPRTVCKFSKGLLDLVEVDTSVLSEGEVTKPMFATSKCVLHIHNQLL